MSELFVDSLSFSPLFSKLLVQRGLEDPQKIEQFLSSRLEAMHDPFLMKDMRGAVERIHKAIRDKEQILIHGDYDVDGITGAALVAATLSRVGANFQTFLPDRSRDGYGVSKNAIEKAAKQGVSLLITVDCGISAKEQIDFARSAGVDVIIIDHHRLPADGVPNATFILNPLQEDCSYPFKDLSAAGLALKLSYALLGPSAFDFLDLATLSTICDVAPLKDENRILVTHGLQAMAKSKSPGIQALVKVANIRTKEMNVGHVGFMLGPRLNAAGRMSSADIALRLLLTSSQREAESLAEVLNEENKTRQKEERGLIKEAIEEAERVTHFNRDRVIVVGKEGWHAGVIGIVASRLVERYHRPALVIAFENGKGKGSGRSIKGFHLFYALEACKDLLLESGGHEQAAGLSMVAENLGAFRKKINDYALQNYDPNAFVKKTTIDLEISLEDLKGPFLRELKMLEPHGAGNPRPVFHTKNLEIKKKPEKNFQTFKFWLSDGFGMFQAQWTDRTESGQSAWLEMGNRIDLSYAVKVQMVDGWESVILEVKEVTPTLQ